MPVSAVELQLLSREEILLRTRRRFFLRRFGGHGTLFGGQGLDFRELREYNSDDDIRHINWKSTARTRTPAVNVFNESRQIHVLVVFLAGGGLVVGEPRRKQASAIEAMTALGYAALESDDRLSILLFDRKALEYFPPSTGRAGVERAYEFARELDPWGRQVDYPALEEEILSRMGRRRGLLFLVGDFMEESVELSRLAALHELHCVVVRDRRDEELPASGSHLFIDAGSGERLETGVDGALRRRYREALQAQDARLFERFRRAGIRRHMLHTHEETVAALARSLRL
ncbi:DUF58 domain-containing protein [Nitratifractor sp.]